MLNQIDKTQIDELTVIEQPTNHVQKFPKKIRVYNKVGDKYYWPIGDKWTPTKSGGLGYLEYMGTLNDEQEYIMWVIQERGFSGWTIMMKTGRGKTHIIINLLSNLKTSTLILCHSLETVQGMFDSIKKYSNIKDGDIGMLTSKKKVDVDAPILITTHSGFQRKSEEFRGGYQQIIYDECDYNLSFPYRMKFDSCMSSALIMSDAEVIRWLSWTPYRDASWDEVIIKLFWELVYMEDQENNWYNIIPEISVYEYKRCYWYIFENRHELREQIMEDEDRCDAQIQFVIDNIRDYNLVLLKNIVETENVYNELKDKHKNVVLIHWQLKWPVLKEALAKLDRYVKYEQPFIVVATIDKFGRWVDIPIIDTLFMLSPIKFKGTVVQSVWRALRNYPGKDRVVIFDWHDLPLLKKQWEERLKSYRQEYWKDVLINYV